MIRWGDVLYRSASFVRIAVRGEMQADVEP
jgi:hypothetical protein